MTSKLSILILNVGFFILTPRIGKVDLYVYLYIYVCMYVFIFIFECIFIYFCMRTLRLHCVKIACHCIALCCIALHDDILLGTSSDVSRLAGTRLQGSDPFGNAPFQAIASLRRRARVGIAGQ